jgi:carbon-monoxide dehydrogenase medium subunit
VKPAPFTYHDPGALPEALALLARHEDARPLAGGQSLMPMLNMRYATPGHLVDLNNVAGLAGIERHDEELVIGAMTRQRDLERLPDCPLVSQALAHVGHRQTRNRGTIGGSLCHLDPAAELPAVMLALDATLVIEGQGRRELAMAAFPAGFMTTALAPGELLTAIRLPLRPARTAFVEMARRQGDFAVVGVAVALGIEAGRIARAAIAVCGLGDGPVRCPAGEALLVGRRPEPEAFQAAADEAGKLTAQSDMHAGEAFRHHLARVLTARALAEAMA